MTIEPITGETTATEPAKSCVDCAVKACRKGEAEKYPAFCLTKNMNPDLLQEAIDCYHEEENHKVLIQKMKINTMQNHMKKSHMLKQLLKN